MKLEPLKSGGNVRKPYGQGRGATTTGRSTTTAPGTTTTGSRTHAPYAPRCQPGPQPPAALAALKLAKAPVNSIAKSKVLNVSSICWAGDWLAIMMSEV